MFKTFEMNRNGVARLRMLYGTSLSSLIRAKVCSVFKLKFALNIPYYDYLFLETRHTISRCHIATHFDLKACPSTCLNLFVVTKCLKHTLGYHDTDITIYMHQQTQKANMAKEVFV